MKLTGAQALIKSLEMQGVDVMFGLPGGAILPVYDPIIDSSIRHVLVRHEQGAGHMAEGYAMVTGKPGVAMVTSGPGATNIVTPLANAYMDSTPLVVVSGQVATGSIGTDAFQECDITGVTMGITKHNWLIKDVNDIPSVVAAAFHVATTGRPGPVLIDFPRDIANATMEWYWPTSVEELDLPGYHPHTVGDPALVRQAAELIRQAQRPVLYVGGGVLKARAAEALRSLAERTGYPGGHHLDGARRLPRLASPVPGDARHARQLHRGDGDAAQRPSHQSRGALRRPGDGKDRRLCARSKDHPCRHRPGRAGQGAHGGRRYRRGLPAGDRGVALGHERQRRDVRRSRIWRRGGNRCTSGRSSSPSITTTPRVVPSSRRWWSSSCATPRLLTPSWCRG